MRARRARSTVVGAAVAAVAVGFAGLELASCGSPALPFPPEAGTPDVVTADVHKKDTGTHAEAGSKHDANPCPSPQLYCKGECTEPSENANCGKCGNACNAASSCTKGKNGDYSCVSVCGEDAACICALTCSGGSCDGGGCSCPTGETVCSGVCTPCANGDCDSGMACPAAGCNSSTCDGECLPAGCVITLASNQNGPAGIAVAGNTVYWTDYTGAMIASAPVQTTGMATQVGAQTTDPLGIAAAGDDVYWFDQNAVGPFEVGTDGQAALSTLVVTAIAASANGAFIGTAGNVAQADGTEVCAVGTPVNVLAVSSTDAYFVTTLAMGGEVIEYCELVGGNPFTLAMDVSGVTALAPFGDVLYWTNAAGALAKVPIAGGTPTTLATGADLPQGLAVDGTNAYAVEAGGAVITAPLAAGSSWSTLVTGAGQASMQPPSVGIVRLANGNLFWTSPGAGNVYELEPQL